MSQDILQPKQQHQQNSWMHTSAVKKGKNAHFSIEIKKKLCTANIGNGGDLLC